MKSNLNIRKPDCFGFNGKGCNATTYESCENCKFYKTKIQFELDLEKSRMRLTKLRNKEI